MRFVSLLLAERGKKKKVHSVLERRVRLQKGKTTNAPPGLTGGRPLVRLISGGKGRGI